MFVSFDGVQCYCPVAERFIKSVQCIEICDVADRLIKSRIFDDYEQPIVWNEQQAEKCRNCKYHSYE